MKENGISKDLGLLKNLSEPVKEFLSAIINTPAKEAGEWAADAIRGKRFQTQVKILNKAQKLVEDSGISPGYINMKVLVPLLESGSLEDDGDIVNMWANLLATASVSKKVRTSYVGILKELEPVEARIMQHIYQLIVEEYGYEFNPENEYVAFLKSDEIRNVFGLVNAEFEQAIDNLYRLKLLSPPASTLDFIENKDIPFAHYTKKEIGVTYLGYHFCLACNFNKSKLGKS